MVRIKGPLGCALVAILVAGSLPNVARAQATSEQLGEITVTADRLEEPVNSTGSDVTVIPGSRIEQWGANGITEVLREVVGVDVTPTGGPNTATEVRVRGGDPGQVLVMIDGIPIGNVAGTDGSLDFSNLSAIDIDRIEIVRGPQSSLYGSDAMSGVINIITKKGKKGEQRRTLTIQGGSYGTIQGTATVAGSTDNWIYSLGVTDVYAEGFPTYGFRINRPLFLSDGVTPLPPLPSIMPANKGGANGNFSYILGPGASVDFGFDVFENNLQYSNPYAVSAADVFSSDNHSTTWIGNAFVRANATTGILTNHLTVFGNTTDMASDNTEACYDAVLGSISCTSYYRGERYGAEYQGQFAFGPYGSLIVGARNMTETANTSSSIPYDSFSPPVNAQQVTNSAYAEYSLPLFSRLDLTFGGRIDSIQDGETFVTGRATAAYHIDETGTKLRAAFGNGAKAPTLYQRFSQYGDPNLLPQQNVGGEVGIDQKLFQDRLTLSATAYNAFYRNLIAFGAVSTCTLVQDSQGGCYYNIGTAQTRGGEVTADAALVPDVLHVRGGYTYNLAVDTQTHINEYRVPLNSGYISLVYTGVPKLSIEPRLLLVGPALDENFLVFPATNVVLAGYARLDCIVNYKINDTFTAFVRGENLTDTRYETVYNYSTPGASVYAGLTAKF